MAGFFGTALVWVHILAAIVWIGGMAFLGLVIVPVMRQPDLGPDANTLFHRAAVRFRNVGWICIGLLLASGLGNLSQWRVGWERLVSGDFWGTPFGSALAVKLSLIAAILALSLAHDFYIGPRASDVIRRAADSAEAQRLRAAASWIGRLNFLLALLVVWFAVVLAKGGFR